MCECEGGGFQRGTEDRKGRQKCYHLSIMNL